MADLLVNGIVVGSILTLGAIGVSLIADILNFFNFAHGDLISLGAYLALGFVHLLPAWGTFPGLTFGPTLIVALVLSMIGTSLIALGCDWCFLRRLRERGASPLFLALASLGIAFMLRSGIRLVWGPQVAYYSRTLQMAHRLPLGITLKLDEAFVVVIALALVTGVHLFLRYSRIGKAMRATSDNQDLAQISGISTTRVMRWTWILASSLTAAAGVLYGVVIQLRPIMGWNLLIPIFVAVIVGGVGNFWGAWAGGMLIGIAQEMLTGLLQHVADAIQWDVSMTAYKPAVAFVLMAIVLLWRPQGLFGEETSS